jgi:hypothetical protein
VGSVGCLWIGIFGSGEGTGTGYLGLWLSSGPGVLLAG